jgi:hypothetical protein
LISLSLSLSLSFSVSATLFPFTTRKPFDCIHSCFFLSYIFMPVMSEKRKKKRQQNSRTMIDNRVVFCVWMTSVSMKEETAFDISIEEQKTIWYHQEITWQKNKNVNKRSSRNFSFCRESFFFLLFQLKGVIWTTCRTDSWF